MLKFLGLIYLSVDVMRCRREANIINFFVVVEVLTNKMYLMLAVEKIYRLIFQIKFICFSVGCLEKK